MPDGPIVCNFGPLIALSMVGQLELLRQLYRLRWIGSFIHQPDLHIKDRCEHEQGGLWNPTGRKKVISLHCGLYPNWGGGLLVKLALQNGALRVLVLQTELAFYLHENLCRSIADGQFGIGMFSEMGSSLNFNLLKANPRHTPSTRRALARPIAASWNRLAVDRYRWRQAGSDPLSIEPGGCKLESIRGGSLPIAASWQRTAAG